jgi:predicted membrane-bound mannosyltransferase
MVSFLIPLCLVCGYAAEQIYQWLPRQPLRILWLCLLGVTLLASWRLSAEVNFERYADNSNSAGYFYDFLKARKWTPYEDGQYGFVYAQTEKDFHQFVKTLYATADKYPTQKETGIYLATSEYWPLPWYMRHYTGVAFSGTLPAKLDESSIAQPILVAKSDQQVAIETAGGWRLVERPFALRPGVDLLIYERKKQ